MWIYSDVSGFNFGNGASAAVAGIGDGTGEAEEKQNDSGEKIHKEAMGDGEERAIASDCKRKSLSRKHPYDAKHIKLGEDETVAGEVVALSKVGKKEVEL